jgi:predicted SAM-dependent methyltransferase
MKLHLGCGNKIIPNFINIDILPSSSDVMTDNVATLQKINDETVELIYACHVLEHFGRHEYLNVLRCWHKKLKSGGKIMIAVPDFNAAARWYLKNGRLEDVLGLISGGQKNEYDFHKVIFDFETLRGNLESMGFTDISLYDCHETSHSHQDDYSQAYLPHMDKENGTLMSLNITAIKK